MPHLNKKQTKKIQTQSSADKITPSFSLAHQKKNKQTKHSKNLTLYETYTNHWAKFQGQKPKGRMNSTLNSTLGKGDLKQNKFKTNKQKIMKRQRNTA